MCWVRQVHELDLMCWVHQVHALRTRSRVTSSDAFLNGICATASHTVQTARTKATASVRRNGAGAGNFGIGVAGGGEVGKKLWGFGEAWNPT